MKHTSVLARKPGYLWLFLVTFVAIASMGHALENIRITNELTLGYNSISGDGKDQSSLSKGYRYLNILGINGNGKLANGYEYQYLGGFKFTDDIRNDMKNISLTNLQARFSNNINTYTAGDVLEYFSQYSLNSALKGVSYRYTDPNSQLQNIGLIYGIAYPRWDNFGGEDELKAIRRHALGGTIRHTFTPELTAGLSLVQAFDETGTRVLETDPAYSNGVYAVDAEYNPFPGLLLNSELALSNATVKVKDMDDDSDSGSAFKIGGVGTGGPSRVSAEFERVSTDFLSLMGAATPDREKFKTQWRYNYNTDITTRLGLLWYRNNLDDKLADTTNSMRPEAGVTIRNVFMRTTATADIDYKLFSQTTGDVETLDNIFNINYRDQFNNFDTDSNVGLTLYSTETDIRDSTEYTLNTSIGTQYQLEDMNLRPNLSLGIWNMSDDLVSKSNSIFEYALGSALEMPAQNIVARVRLGQNMLKNDISAEDSNKFFFSGDVYYRPDFLAQYKATMFVKIFYNSFNYTTTTNNFRETGFQTGLNTQF